MKNLHIACGFSYRSCDEAFVNCKSLESFTIATWSAVNVIRTILEANKKLKTLKLHESSIFKKGFSSEKDFKLTEFSFDDLCFNQDYLQNFNQFLIKQRDSLETMKLGQWMNVQVFETILSMSRLKKLSLGVQLLHPLKNYDVFSRSQSITDLELSHFQNRDGMNCTVLLRAFPNVEILKISGMYNELADAISATCKSLKRLYVELFEASAISNIDFFLELEEFSLADFAEYASPLYKNIFWYQ